MIGSRTTPINALDAARAGFTASGGATTVANLEERVGQGAAQANPEGRVGRGAARANPEERVGRGAARSNPEEGVGRGAAHANPEERVGEGTDIVPPKPGSRIGRLIRGVAIFFVPINTPCPNKKGLAQRVSIT